MTDSPTRTKPPSALMWSSRTNCPKCDKELTLRALRYRHTCKSAHTSPQRVEDAIASATVALEARLAARCAASRPDSLLGADSKSAGLKLYGDMLESMARPRRTSTCP